MARIKCLSIIAGPDYRGQPGETIEVSKAAALVLIGAGAATSAEPAEHSSEIETAALQPESTEAAASENTIAPVAPETAAAVKPKKARK